MAASSSPPERWEVPPVNLVHVCLKSGAGPEHGLQWHSLTTEPG